MRGITRWMLAAAIATGAVAAGGTGRAGIVVGNLSDGFTTPFQVIGGTFAGQQFTVGSQGYTLTGVQASLLLLIPPQADVASLYTDSGGEPGTLVTSFTVPPITSSPSAVNFTPTSSGIVLSPGSTYWFEIGYSSPNSGVTNWYFANSTATTGTGTLGSFQFGVDPSLGFPINSQTPFSIEVDGTPLATSVPEPSGFVMAVLGGPLWAGWAWRRRRRPASA
jgi:hypothetical protein